MDERTPWPIIQQRLAEASARLGTTLETVGQVDGEEIFRLRFGRGVRVLLAAGIHGEEPGGVEGCVTFLESLAESWQERVEFDVWPCLNPYGYIREERHNGQGVDPNRQFRNPEDPLASLMWAALGELRYDFGLDLHEDSDFKGFYIYETTDRPPWFRRQVRDAMARVGPVCERADEPTVRRGLVPRGRAAEPLRQRLEKRRLWPLAFLMFQLSGHAMTIETPVLQPLAVRTRLQLAAITKVLELVTARAVPLAETGGRRRQAGD